MEGSKEALRGNIFLFGNGRKKPEMQVRYYIGLADLTVERFAAAMRNHWCVENKLHWCPDVAMNENDIRGRGNTAELFSGIRAAMGSKYLASVLAGCGAS